MHLLRVHMSPLVMALAASQRPSYPLFTCTGEFAPVERLDQLTHALVAGAGGCHSHGKLFMLLFAQFEFSVCSPFLEKTR